MIITFLSPTQRHPVGGVIMIFELAEELSARGHLVRLVHHPVNGVPGQGVSQLADIEWFSFRGAVDHHFVDGTPDLESLPASDVIFAHSHHEDMPAHLGLPVVIVQGYQMFVRPLEVPTFTAPCPKVCVARWLVDVAKEDFGVPDEELFHLPLGLRHDVFRLLRPIEDRPPQVSFCYHPHIQKGSRLAVRVLERVRARVPGVEVVAFGSGVPEIELPTWMTYERNPPRKRLVEDIYNRSRVFINTSHREGFGLPPIEAMACGAALAICDNGGSRDYAIDGETALVSEPGDDEAMADHVVRLLADDAARRRIAEAGRQYVQRFTWSHSADVLEEILAAYVADPVGHGRPAVV